MGTPRLRPGRFFGAAVKTAINFTKAAFYTASGTAEDR